MVKFSYLDLIRSQRRPIAPLVTTDLTGKTVVVTGANVGLGLEASKHFASMKPARLVIACRSKVKGENALKAIEQATGYKNSELWLLDLSDYSSVIAFAEKFENEPDGGKIDIFVANIGVLNMNFRVSKYGLEDTIQVNNVSTALLCVLMLPRLRLAASEESPSRLVIVSSGAHHFANLKKDAMPNGKNMLEKLSEKEFCMRGGMQNRYNESKLLNILFTRALASHLSPSCPIIVDTVDPGYCVSNLRQDFSFLMAQFDKLAERLLAHTSEQGSRQLVWAAIGGKGRENELRGAYIAEADVQEPNDNVISEDGKRAQDRLWTDTVEILLKVSPKFAQIVEGLSTL